MVAMNDLIIYRRNRWFMGVLRSPMTRRLTLSHLLVVLLPAAVAFWLLQLHLDNRDVKRAQLTAEALLLAHVVEGRFPHRALVDLVQAAVGDILSAFLSNAIQRCAWGDEIRIWTRIKDRMVVVVVEDTGPPLPEGVNQCLCGAGDPAALRAPKVESFTTGLAEAAQIVAAHSGVIRAEPVQPPCAGPAFGVRFLFGLPV